MANTDTITPEERRMFAEDAKYVLARSMDIEFKAAAEAILRLLTALEAAEARADELEGSLSRAISKQSEMSDGLEKVAAANHALTEKAQKAEDEGGKLREQVSALLELNEANMEFVVACIEEESAIADHDDSHAGRTPDTKLRLERVQASLVLAYDNVNNAREKCETLGLNVTPWRQGPRHA